MPTKKNQLRLSSSSVHGRGSRCIRLGPKEGVFEDVMWKQTLWEGEFRGDTVVYVCSMKSKSFTQDPEVGRDFTGLKNRRAKVAGVRAGKLTAAG